jgi:hypothetical protein
MELDEIYLGIHSFNTIGGRQTERIGDLPCCESVVVTFVCRLIDLRRRDQ